MTALASLDSDLLEMILDRTDLIAAVQLTSTCKALEARRGDHLDKPASRAALLKLAQQKLHARDWKGSSNHQALRVLAATELDLMNYPGDELEDAVRSKPFTKTSIDESESMEGGVASIVFGIHVEYDKLRMALMVGRRWWFTNQYQPDEEGNLDFCDRHSQSLDEEPYPLVKGCQDAEPRPPVKNEDYVDMREEADYQRAMNTNMWLKYVLFDAFESHMNRVGLPTGPKSLKELKEDSHINIHCTGFQDCAGDYVVVGIRLGPELPGLGFDTQSQCGKAFFDPAFDDPIVELCDEADGLVTGLLGLKDESIWYSSIWCELYGRLKELREKTPSLRGWPSFYAVYNENC